MPGGTRTFRVFVSSTFADFVAERNALHDFVFPRLRDMCEARGARFQAVDLRWGVSEQAAEDQQTLRTCLEEMRRCRSVNRRPNLIVLLGDRYGWRPLPPEISKDELGRIEQWVDDPADLAMIAQWYGDRERAGIEVAVADIVALLPNAPEQRLQPFRVDDRRRRERLQRDAENLLLDLVGREGEQQLRPATGMKRTLAAELGVKAYRLRRLPDRKADRREAVAHQQADVLARARRQLIEKRIGDAHQRRVMLHLLAEIQRLVAERVGAFLRILQQIAARLECGSHPERERLGRAGQPRELGEADVLMLGVTTHFAGRCSFFACSLPPGHAYNRNP